MPNAKIAAITLYPVKGCGGIPLAHAGVDVRGLVVSTTSGRVGDREWMIVRSDGAFITQREYPLLALVAIRVAGDELVLSLAGRSPVAISLRPSHAAAREVVVWQSTVRAHDSGDDAATWLSAAIGEDVRLMRFDPTYERRCNPDYCGDSEAHTAFADGYPLLVAGTESLSDLNSRLAAGGAAPISMNRFRPNVVLDNLDPYDEDHLDTVTADGITLKLVKPCIRCQVTTTDQATGQVGTEPLATLGAYRTHAALGGVAFGMNAIVVGGAGGRLSVGAEADCRFAF